MPLTGTQALCVIRIEENTTKRKRRVSCEVMACVCVREREREREKRLTKYFLLCDLRYHVNLELNLLHSISMPLYQECNQKYHLQLLLQ